MMISLQPKRIFIVLFTLILVSFSSFLKAQDAKEGEALFSTNCTQCHSLDEKLVGPALRGVTKRRPEDWLLKWIKNSTAVIKSGDKYANELYEKFNKSNMQAFENLSDGQIKSILSYISTAPEGGATASAGGDGSQATSVAPSQTNSKDGGSSNFYSNNTLVILLILTIVLLLITVTLNRVKTILGTLVAQKFPEDAELNKPSWYETRFKPWAQNLNPTLVVLLIVTLVAVIGGGFYFKYANTEIGVQQGYAPTQPINFDHSLHAGQYKINCQYCHNTASYSKQASVPSVNTCMNCHKWVTAKDKYNGEISPEIQKIYKAIDFNPETQTYGTNTSPIKWVRIHNLPDFTYFNHAQHVSIGKVECQTCHGPIETMKKVEQFATLQMGWCVNCHRQAEVDVAGNNYYEDLHNKMKAMGRKSLTVEQNGGLECAKCHY